MVPYNNVVSFVSIISLDNYLILHLNGSIDFDTLIYWAVLDDNAT